MKKLIALISPRGKASKEIFDEAQAALNKFKKTQVLFFRKIPKYPKLKSK